MYVLCFVLSRPELSVSCEAYEDEKTLCSTLIAYLEPLLARCDTSSPPDTVESPSDATSLGESNVWFLFPQQCTACPLAIALAVVLLLWTLCLPRFIPRTTTGRNVLTEEERGWQPVWWCSPTQDQQPKQERKTKADSETLWHCQGLVALSVMGGVLFRVFCAADKALWRVVELFAEREAIWWEIECWEELGEGVLNSAWHERGEKGEKEGNMMGNLGVKFDFLLAEQVCDAHTWDLWSVCTAGTNGTLYSCRGHNQYYTTH